MYIKGFSPSKLNTYDECEFKFLSKYIFYLPEEYNDNLSKDALQFGSYIHKILEDGVDASSVDVLREHATRLRDKYNFSGREKDVEKCIRNFFEFNKDISGTVATELKFDDVEVLPDLKVNGIIDRVVKGKTGKFLVIDYKTSKREKSKRELFTDNQLVIYAAAISKLYNCPIKDITVAHYYPLTGNLVAVNYTHEHIMRRLKIIDKKKWDIRKKKKDEFTPRANSFCDWCGYRNLCPLYGGTPQMLEEAVKKAKEDKKQKTEDKK